MNNEPIDSLPVEDQLNSIQQRLSNIAVDEHELRALGIELARLTELGQQIPSQAFVCGVQTLAQLLELAACSCAGIATDEALVERLLDFVRLNLTTLRLASHSNEANIETFEFIEQAKHQWHEYLSLIDTDFDSDTDEEWFKHEPLVETQSDSDQSDGHGVADNDEISDSQIQILLSALSGSQSGGDNGSSRQNAPTDNMANEGKTSDVVKEPTLPAATESGSSMIPDREMREAYLDDAMRCLASMEKAAMAAESNMADSEPLRQFCRELHTLKGASGTVGLSELASYIHTLETSLEHAIIPGANEIGSELLFEAVDRVRFEVESIQQNAIPQTEPAHVEVGQPSKRRTEYANFVSGDESSIRIRATKLDRLMDMLAELVVLRNRRESHVTEFNAFNEELSRCAVRLRFAEEQARNERLDQGTLSALSKNTSNTSTEVSKDIAAVSRGLKELQKPVSHDNAAISRFIRDFRQELMELRRVPVSGLFSRLQRAARDAAKTEQKHVEVKLVGQHAGLEQEIQERLFESLLHVVRNSVSHGIETPDRRSSVGKPSCGTITLNAHSNAQLLVIEVEDDGSGLDYVEIRKRGIEKGILASDQQTTPAELSKLIFHPGFSTRQQASEISGRGVGMDVVATTMHQLHGRIEVESIPGQGTTMRFLIPLRTGIEHVMVFRLGRQLFALPMQAVTAARTSSRDVKNIARLSFDSTVARRPSQGSQSEDILILRQTNDARPTSLTADEFNNEMALAVDELIGPEEVVVRGLPHLLKQHPLFCGITLSGAGEKVLLLDSQSVVRFCELNQTSVPAEHCPETNVDDFGETKRALVVDDSLTARKLLVKLLHRHGFTTIEAGDGIEAIEWLHREKFDVVFTDLDMPRLGGMELLSDLQSGQYSESPVVVVSSRDEKIFRAKALDLGAADYVAKPISENLVSQLLERLALAPEPVKG